MSFSFCVNKNEVLLLAGFGLLFQVLMLDRKGKIIQDSQRLLCSAIEILERNAATGASDFKKVACAMISVDRFSKNARGLEEIGGRRKSDGNMPAPKMASKSARKLQAIASRFSSASIPAVKQEPAVGRRSTAPTLPTGIPIYARSNSNNSASSVVSDPLAQYGPCKGANTVRSPQKMSTPNLDYLSFNDDPIIRPHHMSSQTGKTFRKLDRERPESCAAVHQAQAPFDNLFAPHDLLSSYTTPSPSTPFDWYSEIWNMSADLTVSQPAPAQSHLSFSEEDITSGEELSSCDLGGEFRGMTMQNVDGLVSLEGLDGKFVP